MRHITLRQPSDAETACTPACSSASPAPPTAASDEGSCRAPSRTQMSLTVRPGGKLCFSLSAFSRSFTQSVYRYLLQRTLNFTTSLDFLILTAAAAGRAEAQSEHRACQGASSGIRGSAQSSVLLLRRSAGLCSLRSQPLAPC